MGTARRKEHALERRAARPRPARQVSPLRTPLVAALAWLALLAAPLAAAPPAPVAPTHALLVRVEAVGTAPPSALTVELTGPAPVTIEVPLTAGRGETTLHLDSAAVASSGWELRGRAAGFWSPATVFPADRPLPEAITLKPVPAGALDGTLRWPEGKERPRELAVELRRVAAGENQPPEPLEAVVACPVGERGEVSCPVPAGRWHARLEASPFAPLYRWGVEIPRGETWSLGTLPVRSGATLVGRVTLPDEEPVAEAEVVLRPAVVPRSDGREAPGELRLMTHRATTNEWGWFQLAAIAPGAFVLTAAKPELAPAADLPLAFVGGEAVELAEPLVLAPPPRLTVVLSPDLEPFGLRPIADLMRFVDSGLEEITEEAFTDGRWRSPPLVPGRYALHVRNERQTGLAWRELEIVDDVRVEIELDLVIVTGEVLLGDEPLASKVFFGGLGGPEGAEVEAPDGTFTTILPRPGTWEVGVLSEHPVVQARGIEVEIRPRRASREAEVTIELPDTTVAGEVVDGEGRPVARAEVKLVGLASDTYFAGTHTDGEGQFEVRGQSPGRYSLHALRGGDTSEQVELDLQEDLPAVGIRLVLEEKLLLRGQVLGRSGPARAHLLAVPFAANGTLLHDVGDGYSDLQGTFTLELPAEATAAQILVFAPGHLFQARRIDISAGSEIVVALEQAGGGTLRIPGPGPDFGAGRRHQLLYVGDQPIPAWIFHQDSWAVGPPNGETFDLPRMPPGPYAYCDLTGEELTLVFHGQALPAASACSTGYLGPGATLELGL